MRTVVSKQVHNGIFSNTCSRRSIKKLSTQCIFVTKQTVISCYTDYVLGFEIILNITGCDNLLAFEPNCQELKISGTFIHFLESDLI